MKPIVLIGLQPQSLALLQCLGQVRDNIHVFIDRRAGKCFEEFSRYGTKHDFYDIKSLSYGLKMLQTYYEERLDVFITCAYLLTEIRVNYRAIYDEYNVFSSPLSWVDLFSTKNKMYDYTRTFGVKTMPYKLLTEYKHGDLKFPLILKRNVEFFLSFKTKIVKDEEDFDKFIKEMPDEPKYVIVQEIVQDLSQIDLALHAYIHEGEIMGAFVVKEVRHCPPGISTFLRESDAHTSGIIIEKSKEFLSQTNFTGFIQIDYKYIVKTDTPIIMDINTRTPASHSAFHTKFSNWREFYASIPDKPCKLIPKNKRITWISIIGDIRARFKERNFKGVGECIGASWDVFCIQDPLPFIMWPIIPTIHRLRKLFK